MITFERFGLLFFGAVIVPALAGVALVALVKLAGWARSRKMRARA